MNNSNILILNQYFKKILSIKELYSAMVAFIKKEQSAIPVLNLYHSTQCGLIQAAKVYHMPKNIQQLVLEHKFSKESKNLFLDIVKDNLKEHNFSDTFSLNLNRFERLELSLFYNKKFYK